MSEPRARRAAGASTAPLLAIVIAFFLPAQRTCGSVDVPARMVVDHAEMAGFLYVYFVAAAALVLLGLALWRGLSRRLELGVLIVSMLAATLSVAFAFALALEWRGQPLAIIGALAVLALHAAVMALWARRASGWPRVARALSSLASALLASPVARELFETWQNSLTATSSDPPELLYGGAIYFGAALLLAVCAAAGVSGSRAVAAAQPSP